MTGLTLLWGELADPPVRAVAHALASQSSPYVVFYQETASRSTVELDAFGNALMIHSTSDEIALRAVTSVFVRPNSEATDSRSAAVLDSLLAWTEACDALVVSRPSAMATNNSKPFQLALIAEVGFAVPPTLITTDAEEVLDFWHRHQEIVYKSVSGVRSVVRRLPEAESARLDDVRWCPTQFQAWIDGVDHRVHIVEDEVFVTRVLCDADDYRYPEHNSVELLQCSLPLEVEERCRQLARSLDLKLAGIDLSVSRDGKWYCYEVNPSPAFTYYDFAHDNAISTALGRTLARGVRSSGGKTVLPSA